MKLSSARSPDFETNDDKTHNRVLSLVKLLRMDDKPTKLCLQRIGGVSLFRHTLF